MNLPANATSYGGDVSGTPTRKAAPAAPLQPMEPVIHSTAQGRTIIGAIGMPITIPTVKQEMKHMKEEQTIS